MTLAYPDARSWAQARSASETPRLGMLESVACQSHPEVVATFGDDGAAVAALLGQRPASAARRGLSAIGIVFAIICLISPIVGMAVLGSGNYRFAPISAQASVPIATIAFIVAAATALVVLILWIRSGARWSGMICGMGVVAAVCGLFATISMPTAAQRDDYPLTVAEQLPVWTTVVLGILLALATLVRFRVRDAEQQAPRATVTTIGDRHAAEQAARGIPDAERAAILADRDAGLRILAERGFLDEDSLDRALTTPLGALFTIDVTGRTSA